MTVRTYFCTRGNSLWTVRTDRNIPLIWKRYGYVCKRCLTIYMDGGQIEDVMLNGCRRCGTRAEIANVYRYVEGDFNTEGATE